MQRPAYYIVLLLVSFSCKLTDDTVAGTYHQENKISSRLILKKDKTFEFTGNNGAMADPGNSRDEDHLNFLTRGTWDLNSKHVTLNSSAGDSLNVDYSFTDSITRFTSITSFNFCNRYGDPVFIRSIQLFRAKPKPHFGNS